MSSAIGLVVAFLAYVLSSYFISRAIFSGEKANYKAVFSTAMAAIVAQLVTVSGILFADKQLHLSLAAMSLLVNVLIVSVFTIRSMKHANLMILLVTYVLSALLSAGFLLFPSSSLSYSAAVNSSSVALFVHIVLSMAAYCVLVISSLYAIQFRYIDAKLKSKTLSLNSHLPPLNVVEGQHFRLLSVGLVLLTLALVAGFAFLPDMFAKEYAHKTGLSMLAWLMFTVLAFGHKAYGWRGNKSVIVTVCASLVLTLAYFGSRFVREFLLN